MLLTGYKLAFNYMKAKRFVDAIDICHHVSFFDCHKKMGLCCDKHFSGLSVQILYDFIQYYCSVKLQWK